MSEYDVILDAAVRDEQRADEQVFQAQEFGQASQEYREAMAALDEARERLQGWVRTAIAGGMSEAQAARHAGVSRNTVRSWLAE